MGRAAEENIARERKFLLKLEDARQVALRMSQAAADRERDFAAKFDDARKVALQMARTSAERAQKLADAQSVAQKEFLKQLDAFAVSERKLSDALHAAKAELSTNVRRSQERAARDTEDAEFRISSFETRLRRHLVALSQQLARLARDLDSQETIPVLPSEAGRYRLKDFDAIDGDQFVRMAYQTILRRAPDRGGFEYYRARLMQGTPKVQILSEIRYSVEGIAAGITISGLAKTRAFATIVPWPVVGRMFKIVASLRSPLDAERVKHAIDDHVARSRARATEQARHKLALMDRMLLDIERSVCALRAPVGPPGVTLNRGPSSSSKWSEDPWAGQVFED